MRQARSPSLMIMALFLCQSTVNITILPANDTIDDVFCEGASYLLPNGGSVSLGGSYDVLLSGLNGCDTNRTFQLSVITAPDTTHVDICDNTMFYPMGV